MPAMLAALEMANRHIGAESASSITVTGSQNEDHAGGNRASQALSAWGTLFGFCTSPKTADSVRAIGSTRRRSSSG